MGGTSPRQGLLCYIRKKAEEATELLPLTVGSIPPWFLLQVLPPGSPLGFP